MYAITIAAYGGGQESNKFTTASSVTAVELFRFQLTNNDTGVQRTVNQLQFQLSSISGIVTSDLTISSSTSMRTATETLLTTKQQPSEERVWYRSQGYRHDHISTSFDIAASTTVSVYPQRRREQSAARRLCNHRPWSSQHHFSLRLGQRDSSGKCNSYSLRYSSPVGFWLAGTDCLTGR